jgi:hypothetical protein
LTIIARLLSFEAIGDHLNQTEQGLPSGVSWQRRPKARQFDLFRHQLARGGTAAWLSLNITVLLD